MNRIFSSFDELIAFLSAGAKSATEQAIEEHDHDETQIAIDSLNEKSRISAAQCS